MDALITNFNHGNGPYIKTITLCIAVNEELKKRGVILFNCTPPNEIYDYGRMKKIVSPLINKYIFDRQDIREAQSAISVEGLLFLMLLKE